MREYFCALCRKAYASKDKARDCEDRCMRKKKWPCSVCGARYRLKSEADDCLQRHW